MLDGLNRLAARLARAVLAWTTGRVDAARRPWLEALAAELDEIDGGLAQLAWALGGLRVLWLDRRRHLAAATYRCGPDALLVATAAALLALTVRTVDLYAWVALVLVVLFVLGLLAMLPAIDIVAHALRPLFRLADAAQTAAPRRAIHARYLLVAVGPPVSLAITFVLGMHLAGHPAFFVVLLGLSLAATVLVVGAHRSVIGAAIGSRVAASFDAHPGEWSRLRPAALAGLVVTLGLLLLLALRATLALDQALASGPVMAGVIVGAADRPALDATLARAGVAQPDVHLTTPVRILAVNGVPLDQLYSLVPRGLPPGKPPPPAPPPVQLPLVRQMATTQFTAIQGYDLAGGQLLSEVASQFSPDWGHFGGGPDEVRGPPGRLLDAADANTLNAVIAMGEIEHDDISNGDTLTVQGLATGTTLTLRVVGEYDASDGTDGPVFGRILADDSVPRTLSGGNPAYADAFHLAASQRAPTLERVRQAVPAAQVYDFATDRGGPGADPNDVRFTGPLGAELAWSFTHALILAETAACWALLAAIVLVTRREARAHLRG
jgi:hypothetical protein